MNHPMQPVYQDKQGVQRFKANKIVCHLLDAGNIDMNQLARLRFDEADRVQFAQLIGYSVCGFGDLSYVSDGDYDKAEQMIKSAPQDPIQDIDNLIAGLHPEKPGHDCNDYSRMKDESLPGPFGFVWVCSECGEPVNTPEDKT